MYIDNMMGTLLVGRVRADRMTEERCCWWAVPDKVMGTREGGVVIGGWDPPKRAGLYSQSLGRKVSVSIVPQMLVWT